MREINPRAGHPKVNEATGFFLTWTMTTLSAERARGTVAIWCFAVVRETLRLSHVVYSLVRFLMQSDGLFQSYVMDAVIFLHRRMSKGCQFSLRRNLFWKA